ncbi:MAG TPA: DUF2550 domain-containing protein [Micromonosporaceae bacterium]
MRTFEVIGLGVLLVMLGLLAIYLRREIISRAGGTIEMNLRLSTFVPERGWAPGLGRFAGDELRWYRLFSLSVRPRRVLSRQGLRIEARRAPEGAERLAMPEGWLVVRCADRVAGTVDLALAETALTGFRSWLEAAPPAARRQT